MLPPPPLSDLIDSGPAWQRTGVAVAVTAAGLAAVRYDSLSPQMDTSDGASLIRAASVDAGRVAVSDTRNQHLGVTLAYVRDRAA